MGKGPLSSPGYRELGQYLTGEISLEEATQRTKYQTHRLARRQYTWFKPGDERIHWLEAAGPGLEARAVLLVQEFLLGRACCGKIGSHSPRRPADEVHQDARCRE